MKFKVKTEVRFKDLDNGATEMKTLFDEHIELDRLTSRSLQKCFGKVKGIANVLEPLPARMKPKRADDFQWGEWKSLGGYNSMSYRESERELCYSPDGKTRCFIVWLCVVVRL